MRNHQPAVSTALALLAITQKETVLLVDAFQPTYVVPVSYAGASSPLFSSVGGDDNRPTPPPDDGDDGGMGEFLNFKAESESLQKAREYMSETSLPISFELQDDDGNDNLMDNEKLMDDDDDDDDVEEGESSALIFGGGSDSIFDENGRITEETLANNAYMQVVSKLSPSELISKFTATANPRVQEAVRTTILGLIGSLPKMAFDTTTITSGQRLASLMFQLQMTGYMFKNAEYRLSMSQSLGMTNGYSSNLLLAGKEEEDPLVSGKVKGKLKVRYGEDESSGMEIEVDAAAYMSELRSEVSRLKEELAQSVEAKDEALKKDLLMYIRTLPRQEMKSLTDTMSKDVLVCMKGLVQAVLGGIGDGQITAETVTEQSGEAMAQLCMWQLAVGYNLRELEVREEMKESLKQILGDEDEGGVDFSDPSALE
jgi:hypothetical protein